MGDLFVAADRLQHDPRDDRMAADLSRPRGGAASGAALRHRAPGVAPDPGLAAALATDLEEAADEETVAADARAVREYLRDLV